VPLGKWKRPNLTDTDNLEIRMMNALRRNATVLLSNEGFTLKNGFDMKALVAKFAPLCNELTAVFIHRPTLEYLQSRWNDYVLYNAGLGEPFGSFVLREKGLKAFLYTFGSGTMGSTWPVPFSASGYDLVMEAFGAANVRVASLPRLAQDNCSVPTYLICGISLLLEGDAFRLCQQKLSEKMAIDAPNRNVSPPPGVLDVIRLSRVLRLADCGKSATFEKLAIKNFNPKTTNDTWRLLHRAEGVAASFPMLCDDARHSALGAMSLAFDAAFYRRTGMVAPHPQLTAPAICHVDETELNSTHFDLLRFVYGGCDHVRASSASQG